MAGGVPHGADGANSITRHETDNDSGVDVARDIHFHSKHRHWKQLSVTTEFDVIERRHAHPRQLRKTIEKTAVLAASPKASTAMHVSE
jgi:macrodomain Ter protein organizer (MatP/YcbG family)